MGYEQETSTQMSLFPEEKITTTKYASVPMYKISLLREGQIPTCKHFSFADEGLLEKC